MIIESIEIKNVRNFESYDCEFTPGINLIYGKNGKGKTTILESIYSLSMGKSFKNSQRKSMINFEKDSFYIKGKIITDDNVKKTISVACLGDQHRITIDKKAITSILDLIDVFPVVVMAPENINLIDGSSVIRRKFYDRLFSIIDKQYLFSLKEYNKIIRQRKILLFEKNDEMIQLWSDKMAETGVVLWKKRKHFFQQFSKLFSASWSNELNGIETEIKYSPKSVESKNEFLHQLQQVKKQEILKRSNLYGPQKDDYLFLVNKAPARYFASQGEKKLLLTVLKNTECKFIEKYLGKPPVLLLDDLLAKLDNERGLKIMDMLRSNNQAIITSTDRSVMDILNQSWGKINTIHLD
ncbi:MAG: DNA replication/repair protein RecF [Candidatus Marinimicrobia bacterium]|nr:DNA replication/repair protein RecF [Candidatus Neomarinimicrobiota bacterium]